MTETEVLNSHPSILYGEALAREKHLYGNCLNVHDLPEIFHYWSHRYLRPKLLPFGFESPNAMFSRFLEGRCREAGKRPARFVSLGSGNCDLEIEVALKLLACGHEGFIIDCVDLNPAMLARGRAAAIKAGVGEHFKFTEADLNSWIPAHDCDAAFANQSLHHVLNLEGLFAQVKKSLTPGGSFIISDMIGRNGHQRWPEALAIVQEFWCKLPPSYRFNSRLNRYEELFEDWDCSEEGFEGIRSQDILSLLLREFHFQLFLPFGNIIDPFVDRCFGHHFDATAQWDQAFIDEVHQRDEAEIFSGALTPTHMLAVVSAHSRGPRIFPGNLSPEFCVRAADRTCGPSVLAAPQVAYRWQSWPHSSERELEIACQRLAESASQLKMRAAEVSELETEVQKRTAWARSIEKELEHRTEWALTLEKNLEERTEWALALEEDFEGRTAWALRLRDELEQKKSDLAQLERELQEYLHHPLRYLARLVRGVYRRVRRLSVATG